MDNKNRLSLWLGLLSSVPTTRMYNGLSNPFCSTDTVLPSCLFPLSTAVSVVSVVPVTALYT